MGGWSAGETCQRRGKGSRRGRSGSFQPVRKFDLPLRRRLMPDMAALCTSYLAPGRRKIQGIRLIAGPALRAGEDHDPDTRTCPNTMQAQTISLTCGCDSLCAARLEPCARL